VTSSRYARTEREQRWLLRSIPKGARGPVEIADRYLTGTTLRLRTVSSGDDVVWKLGQKRRADPASPELVELTNLYLTPEEHALLAELPGTELRKTRRHLDHGGRTFAIDELHGPLEGLLLAEVELEPGEPRRTQPPWADRDVTDDDRFSGARLAVTTEHEARELLGLLQ
jgi:CYTH domain-containing protein